MMNVIDFDVDKVYLLGTFSVSYVVGELFLFIYLLLLVCARSMRLR